ncbi:MAG: hypothetical protein V4773_02455 [Verrucomicrobiota bacterium]
MTLVNLCPHPVCILHEDGSKSVLPQAGVARVGVDYRSGGTVEVEGKPVQIIQGVYGEVVGLPEPGAECFYLVSHMVRMALPKRRDLLSPANMVRDGEGNILACRMFEMNMES